MGFVHEAEIYRLAVDAGLRVPRHALVLPGEDAGKVPFSSGAPLVVKGLARDLWHKSDHGAVQFLSFAPAVLTEAIAQMQHHVAPHFPWIGALVCEQVQFQRLAGFPTEALFALRFEPSCGWVVSVGVGGLQAEQLGGALKQPLRQWPVELISSQQAVEEFQGHPIGLAWLGALRGTAPMISFEELQRTFDALWTLCDLAAEAGLVFAEFNPVVPSNDRTLVLLDGVGRRSAGVPQMAVPSRPIPVASLFRPRRVAVAGVSERDDSFGRLILENILRSTLDPEQLLVIKPGAEQLAGVRCVPNLEALTDDPVDLLIVALPAAATVSLLRDLCAAGAGAEVVYLVAGGIGDGADDQGYAAELRALISARRRNGQWTPSIIGPNGLGLVNAELSLSTLFIPEEKLSLPLSQDAPLALISQSGAFFITRLSKGVPRELRYGFCTGNQFDVDASQLLTACREIGAIRVAGVYVEGFGPGQLLALAREGLAWRESGRAVVLYRGGRSSAGMRAAAGHTGALVSDAEFDRCVLTHAGIHVADEMAQFGDLIQWLCASPRLRAKRVAAISNAGYETVCAADLLGAAAMSCDAGLRAGLLHAISVSGLHGLVRPDLPLDLTPMADEDAYLRALDAVLAASPDAVVLGLVPLTQRLRTDGGERSRTFAAAIAERSRLLQIPVGVVVDAGPGYARYKRCFIDAGLPLFPSMEAAIGGLPR